MHVLVVDGDEPSRLLAGYLLLAAGHSVRAASNLRDAADLLIMERFDVIVADVVVADRRRSEALRWIYESGLMERTAFVAVTSLAMKGDREKILAAGFHGYISKPIDPERFASQLDLIRQHTHPWSAGLRWLQDYREVLQTT